MLQLIFRIENRTLLLRNSLNAPNQGNVNISGENLSGVVRDLKTAVTQLRARFDRQLATAAGASGGAGSVYAQGREDLELSPGTAFNDPRDGAKIIRSHYH